MTRLIWIAAWGGLLIAQTAGEGDQMVMVPRKYLSQDALAHSAGPGMEAASKWVGFGKEVGQAMNEGLAAVVSQADRFGATRVGGFVMAMVAWKVIGHDLVAVIVGIPLGIAGVGVWVWSYRRFFFPHRVLVKRDGKVREWKIERYSFNTGDGKVGCVIAHTVFLGGWLLAWILVIFR